MCNINDGLKVKFFIMCVQLKYELFRESSRFSAWVLVLHGGAVMHFLSSFIKENIVKC